MRFHSRRMAIAVGLIGTGGFLMAGPGTGCSSFLAEESLIRADFCFIFDCQNGMLGGTIDPCTGQFDANDRSPEGETQLPLFTDCQLDDGGP